LEIDHLYAPECVARRTRRVIQRYSPEELKGMAGIAHSCEKEIMIGMESSKRENAKKKAEEVARLGV